MTAIAANTEGDYEVILVDNATGHQVIESKNLMAVFRNQENVGFAEGCNQGARAAKYDLLCFLNVDTEPQLGWKLPLVAVFDDPTIAMAGPKLIYPDGNIQCAGIQIFGGGSGGQNRKDDRPSDDVDGATGACLVIRRSVFNEAGQFHTGYFNGNEDVDLSLTVKKLGHRCRYVAESVVIHHESATGPERWVKVHENVALLRRRWG